MQANTRTVSPVLSIGCAGRSTIEIMIERGTTMPDMPTIPTDTRAVWIEQFGGADVVRIKSVPVPSLADNEVLVRTAAASINPVDWKTAEGEYPPMGKDKLPFGLGRDLAGTIVAARSEGDDGIVGARVCAFIGNERGAQSEFVILKGTELVIVPERVDLVTAGALPLAAMTAWQGLFDHGGLEAGQRVLIHGGAGGVGHLAVQFARWKGAVVFATASGRDLDFVRSIGADTAIDYQNDRFEDIATDIDVVFDTQGGETQTRSFGTLRKGGILVSTLEPDEKKATEMGVRIVPRWHAEPDARTLGQVMDLLANGSVTMTVAKTFPFDDINAAYEFTRNEHPRGKVVLSFADI
jgi:NADPH:quinone reductase-like Zn-dependent oxidoreductase